VSDPPPTVECKRQHAVLRATDVSAAIDFYITVLGFRLGFTWGEPPGIAGVNLGDEQMFLELGTAAPEGCGVYFVVGNADALFEFQRANGAAYYRRIRYPGGDVPLERGVCTDVIVRAYRHAGIDLQVLVHQDMANAFDAYPRAWGLAHPDSSIDHRRVPNLATFLRRHGTVLPMTSRASDYRPGDIVTWRLPSGLPHIGLVSERPATASRYLVLHNIGAGARLEDILFAYRVTGHYRYDPAA